MNINDPVNGNNVRVTKKNQLYSFSVSESESQFELRAGKTFNVNSGEITLTDANNSACLYMKNNSDDKLIIQQLIFGFGPGTGITAGTPYKILMVRNPTSGTIIDNATAPLVTPSNVVSNKNFSSSNTEDVTVYKGANGYTLGGDDGDTALIYAFASGRVVVNEVSFELQKGNSVGFEIQPPSGNTSTTLYVAANIFVAEDLF